MIETSRNVVDKTVHPPARVHVHTASRITFSEYLKQNHRVYFQYVFFYCKQYNTKDKLLLRQWRVLPRKTRIQLNYKDANSHSSNNHDIHICQNKTTPSFFFFPYFRSSLITIHLYTTRSSK